MTTLDLPLESNSCVAESAIAWISRSDSSRQSYPRRNKINHYQTLTGEAIDLGTLRGSLQVFVHEMIARMEESEVDRKQSLSATEFADEAREYLHAKYPTPEVYSWVLRGPVGAIYRDCCYRLYAKEYAKEGSAGDTIVEQRREREFIDNIRYNPARILIDCFLEDPATQIEFAREAGLDPGTVSRLFSYVFNPDSSREPSLGLSRLAQTCERLKVVPLAGYFPLPDSPDALTHPLLYKSSGGFTTRERQLRVIVATVTRALCFLENDSSVEELNELRAFLGLHLAALYGVSDVLALDRMTTAVFDDIVAVARIIEIPEPKAPDQDQSKYDLESNSLLEFFEEFNLAVGHEVGTVAFATTAIKSMVEDALYRSREHSHHRVSGDREATSRFDHLREAVRDSWDHSLKVFREWYESELFTAWDSSRMEAPLTTSPAAEQVALEPSSRRETWAQWRGILVENPAMTSLAYGVIS